MGSQVWHAIDGSWKRIGSNPIHPGETSSKPLIGAALSVTTAEAWAGLEAQVGTLVIRRSFAGPGDLPATFAASKAGIDIGNRDSIWSFKPTCSVFAAGGNDAWFNAFLDSIPQGHKTIIILWHEPEEEILAGDFTLAEWTAANIRMGQMVHAKGRPELRTAICTMGPWDFNPSNPAYYTEYWDAGFETTIDYVAMDPYNFTNTQFLDEWPSFNSCMAWAQAKNKPIIFAEFGCAEDPNGDKSKKAAWIQHMYQYGVQAGLYAMLYFNGTNGNNGTIPLASSPQSLAAYAAANADSKLS